jgi:hypothetical protein
MNRREKVMNNDRDDIDDVEDERLSLRDMTEMRGRFAADLARLDERINLATEEDTAAVANDQKEIDWLDKHIANVRRARPLTPKERKERDHKRNVERCKFYFPRGEE